MHSFLSVLCFRYMSALFLFPLQEESIQGVGTRRISKSSGYQKCFLYNVKKYHPDVTSCDEHSATKFMEIKEAYDQINDERRLYGAPSSSGGARQQANQRSYSQQQYSRRTNQWSYTNEDFHNAYESVFSGRKARNASDFDEFMREGREKAYREYWKVKPNDWREASDWDNSKPEAFDSMGHDGIDSAERELRDFVNRNPPK